MILLLLSWFSNILTSWSQNIFVIWAAWSSGGNLACVREGRTRWLLRWLSLPSQAILLFSNMILWFIIFFFFLFFFSPLAFWGATPLHRQKKLFFQWIIQPILQRNSCHHPSTLCHPTGMLSPWLSAALYICCHFWTASHSLEAFLWYVSLAGRLFCSVFK